jgi:type I restriction enzyme, S subunit
MGPEGWSDCTFEELFDFKNGVNAEAKNYGTGTKFVNVMDVFDSSSITQDRIRGSVQITDAQQKTYGLQRGDILFNRTSETPEEIAFASVYLDDRPAVFGGFVIRARPKTKHLDPEFAKYCFNTPTIRRELIRRSQGAIRGNIGQAEMRGVPIALPPLCEQERIAEILSSWDHAIEAVEKLLANSTDQKKALMEQLLTGRTRLRKATSEWQSSRLGDLFTERSESGASLLPLLSITGAAGVIDREEVGRKDTSSRDKSKYRLICPGDIGYNTMRMWQGVSGLSTKQGIVSPAYTVVTPRPNVHGPYMAYLFKLPRTIHDFRRYSQGLVSDTWNLKFRHFKEISVKVPGIEEQKHIAKILELADRERTGLEQQVEKLRLEKRALMQQLLTGKRRVDTPESERQSRSARGS